MSELEALQKALSVGSLEGGAALQVEDLDVVLKLVTFDCVQYATRKQLLRFMSRLDRRNIDYVFTKAKRQGLFGWNRKITVGDRNFLFLDLGSQK